MNLTAETGPTYTVSIDMETFTSTEHALPEGYHIGHTAQMTTTSSGELLLHLAPNGAPLTNTGAGTWTAGDPPSSPFYDAGSTATEYDSNTRLLRASGGYLRVTKADSSTTSVSVAYDSDSEAAGSDQTLVGVDLTGDIFPLWTGTQLLVIYKSRFFEDNIMMSTFTP
jgi:hypothetical protein